MGSKGRVFSNRLLRQINGKWSWLAVIVLLGGAFLLFSNTFDCQWTMDDFIVVVNNPDIRSLGGFMADSYPGRPLRELTYLVDHALFGLHPTGYHFQNIFWHGLNASMVLMLLGRLGASRFVAWGSALLFMTHPIAVEVVANISHRKDSLALAFSLMSILVYVRVRQSSGRQPWRMVGAFALGCVALLAKQNAIGLLLVFATYEVTFVSSQNRFFFRKAGRGAWLAVAVGGGLTLWYGVVLQSHLFNQTIRGVLVKINQPSELVNPEAFFLAVFKSLGFLFFKLVYPVELALEYVYAVPQGWGDPWVWLPMLGIFAFGVIWYATIRRSALVAFAVGWLVAFWLPASNLLWPLAYFAADRYLYAPSVGFFILVAMALERVLRDALPARTSILLGLLAMTSWLSWNQNRVWASEMTLYSHAVKISPQSTGALMGLGIANQKAGNLEKAAGLFHRAADNLNEPKVYYLLGATYERMGDLQKALHFYEIFTSFDLGRFLPEAELSYAWNNIGNIYLERKSYSRALPSYERALEENPNNVIAILNIGLVYEETGHVDEALKYFSRFAARAAHTHPEDVRRLRTYVQSRYGQGL